jgi:hypothetical protein
VSVRDRRDDRQPQSEPVPLPDPVGGEPLERLEEPVDLLGGNVGSGVGHRKRGRPALGVRANVHGSVRDVVPQRILDQVRDEALDQAPVARDGGHVERGDGLDPPHRRLGLVSTHHLAGDLGQVEGGGAIDSPLPLREREQGVDQLLLLRALLEDFGACLPEALDRGIAIAHHHLEQRADRREGSAQLVRGVGDEPPLGVEGTLQAPEERVDRLSEPAELVVGAAQGEPLMQVRLGDPLGGVGDRPQWAEDPAGDHPPEGTGDERHHSERDARLDHELVQVRDALEGPGGDDGDPALLGPEQPLDLRRQTPDGRRPAKGLLPRQAPCRSRQPLPGHGRSVLEVRPRTKAAPARCWGSARCGGATRSGGGSLHHQPPEGPIGDRGVVDERVGDRKQRRARDQEQAAVEERQPPAHRRLRVA